MGSPIEDALYAELCELLALHRPLPSVVYRARFAHPSANVSLVRHGFVQQLTLVDVDGCELQLLTLNDLVVVRQCRVDGYKVDILLHNAHATVAVECDGHDWHERTKQQASSDRARDRAIAAMGAVTIRFTGSDIHRDANQCALDVLRVLDGAVRHMMFANECAVHSWVDNEALYRDNWGISAGLI